MSKARNRGHVAYSSISAAGGRRTYSRLVSHSGTLLSARARCLHFSPVHAFCEQLEEVDDAGERRHGHALLEPQLAFEDTLLTWAHGQGAGQKSQAFASSRGVGKQTSQAPSPACPI